MFFANIDNNYCFYFVIMPISFSVYMVYTITISREAEINKMEDMSYGRFIYD